MEAYLLDEGALSKLRGLSRFLVIKKSNSSIGERRVSHHIGDRLLKDRCFQCHIDSPGGPEKFSFSRLRRLPLYSIRQMGCIKGEDSTISRVEPGHPARHRMITLTPDSICQTMSSRLSGNRRPDILNPEWI